MVSNLVIQSIPSYAVKNLMRIEKNPSQHVKGTAGNNNFNFQTSKQIFGSDFEKCSGAQSNIITSSAEQQPRVIYQMLNFRNDFSLIA